jgi:hypothetical protein
VPLALQAGVHSGDSACSLPTQTIPTTTLNTIRDWTFKVAKALNVVGLINIQYAIQVRGQSLLIVTLLCHHVTSRFRQDLSSWTQHLQRLRDLLPSPNT